MTQDKLNKILELVSSIKKKTLFIRAHTENLKIVNTKIELFLNSLDAYSNVESMEPKEEKPKKIRGSEKIKAKNVESPKKPKIEDVIDPRTTISSIFATNKSNKNMALHLYDLLNGQDVMGLDDIVKNIKLSKYRVIEILNVLVREKLIVKYFDKGFFYKLNKEI